MAFDCSNSNANLLYRGGTYDQISGTSYPDVSSHANAGTITSGPLANGGLISGWASLGNSLGFNGSNQFIPVVKAGAFAGSNISLAFWVKFSSLGAGEKNMIFERDNDTTTWGFAVETNGTSLSFNIVVGPTAYLLVSSTTISTGIWCFVACTYDSTSMRLYVMGLEDGASPKAVGGSLRGTGSQITLGGLGLAGGRYLNGALAFLSLYNIALTAGNVTDLYNYGASASGLLMRRRRSNSGRR